MAGIRLRDFTVWVWLPGSSKLFTRTVRAFTVPTAVAQVMRTYEICYADMVRVASNGLVGSIWLYGVWMEDGKVCYEECSQECEQGWKGG